MGRQFDLIDPPRLFVPGVFDPLAGTRMGVEQAGLRFIHMLPQCLVRLLGKLLRVRKHNQGEIISKASLAVSVLKIIDRSTIGETEHFEPTRRALEACASADASLEPIGVEFTLAEHIAANQVGKHEQTAENPLRNLHRQADQVDKQKEPAANVVGDSRKLVVPVLGVSRLGKPGADTYHQRGELDA